MLFEIINKLTKRRPPPPVLAAASGARPTAALRIKERIEVVRTGAELEIAHGLPRQLPHMGRLCDERDGAAAGQFMQQRSSSPVEGEHPHIRGLPRTVFLAQSEGSTEGHAPHPCRRKAPGGSGRNKSLPVGRRLKGVIQPLAGAVPCIRDPPEVLPAEASQP